MHHVAYWLLHVTGIDTQQSYFYDFWSGIAASGAAWAAIFVAWWTMRIELRALKLESQVLALELERLKTTEPES